MVCGSDSTWGNYKMGQFFYEIEAHVNAGMSPMEAITAGTLDAAKSLMVDNRVGSLEPGKQADILVVNGDASVNIDCMKNVIDVYQSGVRIDRGTN
jgi:imidazolonepropionase-like amidohydrolase